MRVAVNNQPKIVKEHVARAKAYAGRYEVVKSLLSICEALKLMVTAQVFGRERFEIEILINEVLRTLCKLEDVRRFYNKEISYVKGAEKKVYQLLAKLAQVIQETKDREAEDQIRQRKNKIDQMLRKGQDLLEQNQLMDAKKVFRSVVEQFPDEPNLWFDVGSRLVNKQLYTEATEFLRQAMELDPKDSRAYGYLVTCYEELGRIEDAEKLLREALKTFGGNARIYFRLAKIYKDQRKWSDAYDTVRSALGLDSSHAEAQRLLKEVEPRVLGFRT